MKISIVLKKFSFVLKLLKEKPLIFKGFMVLPALAMLPKRLAIALYCDIYPTFAPYLEEHP